jgi:flagellar protein FlgJ
MSTLPSIAVTPNSVNASGLSIGRDAVSIGAQPTTAEDTLNVAKKFEALLIHNMLKAMRTTTLAEKPSNARAMYDDMYDQHLSKLLSESGGLGIASSISRQLNAQQGIKPEQELAALSNVEQSMQALSNNPSTLARNGRITSAFKDIEKYQALINSTDANLQSQTANTASSNLVALKLPNALDAKPFSEIKKDFVDTLLPDAKRNAARLGIQPEIIIAIAALESGWGKHIIKEINGASSHNLFGIKAHDKNLPHTMHKTTEFINNAAVKVVEPFRKFENTASAVDGFADFLLSNPRYKTALETNNDDTQFLRELQRAGYATDPEYANKAIDVLKQVQAIRQRTAL